MRVGRALKRASLPSTPSHAHYSTSTLQADLRPLFRATAQPVAVVTSLMPPSPIAPGSPPGPAFHGATLSSFSSISLDPYPLIAFSLRVPSRMAVSLSRPHHAGPARMVVNVLSDAQEEVAGRFARADLYPRPFEGLEYYLTQEGLPALAGSVGALSCEVVGRSVPLHDLGALERRLGDDLGGGTRSGVWEGEGVASELFIARVTRVENIVGNESRTPLIYYRRAYTSVVPAAPKEPQEPPSGPLSKP